jgi:hypothetical protein
MELYTIHEGLERGDYIIQKDEECGRFYVQEVQLLDMGRFNTLTEACSHKIFLEEEYNG